MRRLSPSSERYTVRWRSTGGVRREPAAEPEVEAIVDSKSESETMAVPSRFILHQKPAISGIGRIAFAALTAPVRRMLGAPGESRVSRRMTKVADPLPPELIRQYLDHVGGDPDRYTREVPPHLFPQWTFDQLARTLEHLTMPLQRLVNGGCRLEWNEPLPDATPLHVAAQLVDVDESPRRVRLHHRIETGPRDTPEAVVADVFNVLPLGGSSGDDERENEDAEASNGEESDRGAKVVAEDAEELEHWPIADDAGLDFAKLTGDFNPIHWLSPAAQAAGFSNTILHGFSTMARAFEGLARAGGDDERPEALDVRFTNPLVLPAEVGLYLGPEGSGDDEERTVFVGDGPGETAYMMGEVSYGSEF